MLVRAESRSAMDAAPMHCSCKQPTGPHLPPPAPRSGPLYTHAGELPGVSACAVLFRIACAELIGTALLVALGGLAAPGDAVGAAAAAGLVVAALVQCFVRASGAQFNPAVTAAALVAGRMSYRRVAVEVAAQAGGATLGAAALRAALGPGAGAVGTPRDAGAAAVLALEAAAGAVLALANSSEWDPRAAPRSDSWPLRIGATVAALTLATARSGASMNPARHFGPALVNGAWHLCWAYWAAPVAGAMLAAAAYRLAWYPPPTRADCPRCTN